MTRIVWILAVLLSHWRRHPMQLATLLIGLISATALWSGVQALNAQARSSYDRAAATFGGAQDGDAGRPHHDLPAAIVRRSAPRRLAGISGARRPHPDRRTVVAAAGNRAGHPARRSRQCAGDRTGRSAILHDAARRNAGGARNACRSQAAGGRDADGERRRRAAAAAGAGATGARRAGGRYRRRPAAPEHAGSGFAAAGRQGQRQARAARNNRRRQTASGRAGRGERPRTAHRQLSSQPDRVRPAVLCCRPVHRQFRDRARLRAAAADAAHLARLRGIRAPAECGAGWSNWCRWRCSRGSSD